MKSLKMLKAEIYIVLFYRIAVLLLIYSLLRLGFYLSNLRLFPNISSSNLNYMMLGGMKFDLVAILYLNSLFIFLQAVPFSFRYNIIYQSFCKWIYFISNGIGFALNYMDFAYYRFTLKRTTGTVFEQFSNEDNKLKLTFNF